MSEQERKETVQESKILEALDHPNIVKFIEVFKTKKGKLCIVMDYADGGDLQGKIKDQRGRNLPEDQVLQWFTQICLGLKHIHDRKILHRDLKGQNIFLTKSGIVKVGDFGIAKVLSHTMANARTVVGTPYYLSPEIVSSKPYSFRSDIWSLGVILYELVSLKPPFDAPSLHFLAMKIVRGAYNPVPAQYSKELKSLIQQCLNTNSQMRPDVNKILNMPIIQNRIKKYLTDTIYHTEFSHTILHKQNVFDPRSQQNRAAVVGGGQQASQRPSQPAQPVRYGINPGPQALVQRPAGAQQPRNQVSPGMQAAMGRQQQPPQAQNQYQPPTAQAAKPNYHYQQNNGGQKAPWEQAIIDHKKRIEEQKGANPNSIEAQLRAKELELARMNKEKEAKEKLRKEQEDRQRQKEEIARRIEEREKQRQDQERKQKEDYMRRKAEKEAAMRVQKERDAADRAAYMREKQRAETEKLLQEQRKRTKETEIRVALEREKAEAERERQKKQQADLEKIRRQKEEKERQAQKAQIAQAADQERKKQQERKKWEVQQQQQKAAQNKQDAFDIRAITEAASNQIFQIEEKINKRDASPIMTPQKVEKVEPSYAPPYKQESPDRASELKKKRDQEREAMKKDMMKKKGVKKGPTFELVGMDVEPPKPKKAEAGPTAEQKSKEDARYKEALKKQKEMKAQWEKEQKEREEEELKRKEKQEQRQQEETKRQEYELKARMEEEERIRKEAEKARALQAPPQDSPVEGNSPQRIEPEQEEEDYGMLVEQEKEDEQELQIYKMLEEMQGIVQSEYVYDDDEEEKGTAIEDDDGDKSDNDFERDDSATPKSDPMVVHKFNNTLETVREEENEDTLAQAHVKPKNYAPGENELPKEEDDRDDLDDEEEESTDSSNSKFKDVTFAGQDTPVDFSKFESIESLRSFLEDELGEESLMKAYPILKDFGDNILFDDKLPELRQKLEGIISPTLLSKLHQHLASLIFMELEAEKGGGTSGLLAATMTLKNIHATANFGMFK